METLFARAARGGPSAVAAVSLAALALLWLASVVFKQRRGRLPPGPTGLPVLGNLLHLLGQTLPHRAMVALSKQYGPIIFLKLGSAPSILISDASLAKECLSSPNDKIFANRPPMEVLRRIAFGSSIGITTAPYGEDWRYARKLCSLQLFTNRRVSEFEPFRRMEIVSVMDKMTHQIQNRKAAPGDNVEPVDLSHLLTSLIEAITCRTLLGRPSSEIHSAGLGLSMHELVHRVGEVFQLPFIGDFIPALGFLDWKAKASIDDVRTGFGILIDSLIRERQQRPPGSPTVVLDVLLENLDLDRAKSIVMELLVGSIDTSTTVLDWAMAELMSNPQAMQKLQEELDKVAKGRGRIIEEADMGSLAYMKAVVKETMRLHAPVPLLIPQMSSEECTVGGYAIPKGTRLFVNAWAIGRDPKTWEDPERFWPERFLSDKGSKMDVRGQHFELLPFGGGRRSCPGTPLALPLVESILAHLVYNFDWQVPPGLPIDFSERFGTIVCRASPLYAIPHLRH